MSKGIMAAPATTGSSRKPRRCVMKYPDLHASYFFCAVAYHKGIAPAARALGIDERRNGEEIIQLEKFAGQKLIRRNTRYIGLTALGRTYFENMAPLVAHLENRTKLLALGQLERPFMRAAPADARIMDMGDDSGEPAGAGEAANHVSKKRPCERN
jgi:hypothetical protein